MSFSECYQELHKNSENCPVVPYKNREIFIESVYKAQRLYIDCLVESFSKQQAWYLNQITRYKSSQEQKIKRTDIHQYASFLNNKCFPYLQEFGVEAIMFLTQNKGRDWCVQVHKFIFWHVLRVAQNYCSTINYYTLYQAETKPELEFNAVQCLDVMKEEVYFLFAGRIPFCQMAEQGFVGQLLSNNFLLLCQDIYPKTYTDEVLRPREIKYFSFLEFDNLILTLCMGTHHNLGAKSPLFFMNTDMLQIIILLLPLRKSALSQEIFREEERWLYA